MISDAQMPLFYAPVDAPPPPPKPEFPPPDGDILDVFRRDIPGDWLYLQPAAGDDRARYEPVRVQIPARWKVGDASLWSHGPACRTIVDEAGNAVSLTMAVMQGEARIVESEDA